MWDAFVLENHFISIFILPDIVLVEHSKREAEITAYAIIMLVGVRVCECFARPKRHTHSLSHPYNPR